MLDSCGEAILGKQPFRSDDLGKRRGIALGTNDAEAAAVKARDFYFAVYAKGWDAAEAEFNPEMIVRRDDPTVGEFLREVEAKAGLKPKTFRNYSGYFRRIVADSFGMGTPMTNLLTGTAVTRLGWNGSTRCDWRR